MVPMVRQRQPLFRQSLSSQEHESWMDDLVLLPQLVSSGRVSVQPVRHDKGRYGKEEPVANHLRQRSRRLSQIKHHGCVKIDEALESHLRHIVSSNLFHRLKRLRHLLLDSVNVAPTNKHSINQDTGLSRETKIVQRVINY